MTTQAKTCITHLAANATAFDPELAQKEAISASVSNSFVQATLAKRLLISTQVQRLPMGSATYPDRAHPADEHAHKSRFALAIGRSAKKGIIELGVEAYTDVLIQCQKEQSPTLTMPLLRSDSQQSHCFRF